MDISRSAQGDALFEDLVEFYKYPSHWEAFVDIVRGGNKKASLRLFDYFTTNYSKHHHIWLDEGDIWCEYKDCLHGYTKLWFDPFCRRDRISVRRNDDTGILEVLSDADANADTDAIRTTVGQLNFFKWCIIRNVMQYIVNNYDDINKAMTLSTFEKKKHNNRNKKLQPQIANPSPTTKPNTITTSPPTRYKSQEKQTRGLYTTHMKIVLKLQT